MVCTPVDLIAEYVRETAAACPAGALMTDAGSTKASIVRQLNGALPRSVSFVGSHPIAGSEKNGCQHARADLFEGRVIVVTPTRKTSENDLKAHGRFLVGAGRFGGRDVAGGARSGAGRDKSFAAPARRDLGAATTQADLPLTAGGWRDSTRIAAGDVELWTQILADNHQNVLKSLGRFEKSLAAFRSAIERGDKRRLSELLMEAKQLRDAVGS